MVSYHGSQELKTRFTAHVERHRQLDQIAQGTYGTERGGKWRGCAVGCSLRSLDEIEGRTLRVDNNDHADLAERLGIPLVLARLEDRIFEGLAPEEAKLWPTLFARAIPVGADMSLVWPRFAHWMLSDGTSGVIRFAKIDQTKAAVSRVAELFAEQIAGGKVSAARWSAAAARWSAAAAVARWSAADAAAAAAAAAAADAARWSAAAAAARWSAAAAAAAAAADAAADAAAARQKHYKAMAEALLRFMSEAPVT